MRYVTVTVLTLLLAGCGLMFSSYRERPYDEIVVFPSKSYTTFFASKSYSTFALQIRYQIAGRGGNAHQFSSLQKYEIDWEDWLYLDSLQGKLAVDKVGHKTGYKEVSVSKARGYAEFHNGVVTVNVEVPVYKTDKAREHAGDTVEWVPYKFNGAYRLRIHPSMTLEGATAGDR